MATLELLEEEAFDPGLGINGAVVRQDDELRLHIHRGSPENFFLSRDWLSGSRSEPGLANEERQGWLLLGVSYDEDSGFFGSSHSGPIFMTSSMKNRLISLGE